MSRWLRLLNAEIINPKNKRIKKNFWVFRQIHNLVDYIKMSKIALHIFPDNTSKHTYMAYFETMLYQKFCYNEASYVEALVYT